jgi:cob(I)alamin adenosyltransferase
MIYFFTGNGKGKTTSAFGTALRALGRGKKVHIIQFMKSKDWFKPAEVSFLESKGGKLVTIDSFGKKGWVDPKKPSKEDKDLSKSALERIHEVMEKEKPFLLIVDEIFVAYLFKTISIGDIKKVMKKSKENIIHLILTGRGAPKRLYKHADLITEMKEIKHPYEDGKGQKAIEGLEY